jgi:hypothetical protein
LTLCQAAANLPSSANIDVNLHMNDATGRQTVERTFTVQRGEAMQLMVEFDVPRGTFRVTLLAPQIRCSAINYWSFLSEQNRSIAETLVNGVAPVPHVLLFEGKAPAAFLYLNPTFVLLDKSVDCNKPAGDPLDAHAVVEDDDSSFYVWMDSNPLLDGPGRAVLALQLATPTGENHYLRVKAPFLRPWSGYPFTFELDVSDDLVDWLSGQPVDTLLCPKMYMVSAG